MPQEGPLDCGAGRRPPRRARVAAREPRGGPTMLKPTTAVFACVLAAGAIVLPACGGESADGEPASQSVPTEKVDDLDRRVGDLEKKIEELRREVQESGDGSTSGASAGDEAGTSAGSDGASAGAGSTSGASAGAGAGGGSDGSGGGSGGGDAGAGPDPGTAEDDRSVYDICGPNP